MEYQDSGDNWFSYLDLDGNGDDGSVYQSQTNSCVKIEELRRHTSTEVHSLYPSSGIQSNSAAAVSGLSIEETGFNGGQCSCSWNVDTVAGNSISEDSSKQGYSCLKAKANYEQIGSSSKRSLENQNSEPRASQGTKKARSFSEAQDHLMSERKRRQEMAERFIALSATIPGLKKIDKASVLREAINYVKQLEERIALLEKENTKKSTKAMVFIKKSDLCSASCEKNSNDYCGSNEVLPEVEAIGLDNQVLIRIRCEKRKGIMLKLLPLLENIHLSIVSSSILPFGNSALNITIIAQLGEKYNKTVNDLVKNLRQDLLKLYDMQP